MINKIIQLSKILIMDYYQKLDIYDKKTKKINFRKSFTWLLIITTILITFLSYKIISFLMDRGIALIFFKIYFPIVATVFMTQTILVCCNIFFFSKDFQNILYMPIKPIEILIAKFNTILSIIYILEGMLLINPLLIYGILASKIISYYVIIFFILIIFPIFFILIISTIMLFAIQLARLIKNKDVFQVLISMCVTFIIIYSEIYAYKLVFNSNIMNVQITENEEIHAVIMNTDELNFKLKKFDSYFIVINPIINMIETVNIKNVLIEGTKIILINILMFAIFLFLGKLVYFKNLLKNITYVNRKKIVKKNRKIKYREGKIKDSYVKNEFFKIMKNPTFFLQCIVQYIVIIIISLLLINMFMPIIIKIFIEQDAITKLGKNNFIFQCMCIILEILQILFSFNAMSITIVSREGKDAIIMKYIPVSLFKQFIWKNIPQVLINIIPIIGLAVVVNNNTNIRMIYYIIGIILAMILNIVNCILMSIVDLKNPNLNWTTETSIFKNNKNRIYQYLETFVIILMLLYLTKILKNINIFISLTLLMLIIINALIIIIVYIKKNINKLFSKIY